MTRFHAFLVLVLLFSVAYNPPSAPRSGLVIPAALSREGGKPDQAQSGAPTVVGGASPAVGLATVGAPLNPAGEEARRVSPPTGVVVPAITSVARPTPSVDAGSCVTPCFVRVPPDTWHRAVASSYGIRDGFLGGHLACGGRLDSTTLVVAHRTLPCGTVVSFRFRGHVVTATVRDRGPFVAGRTWDFGPAVARALHFNGLSVVEWRFP